MTTTMILCKGYGNTRYNDLESLETLWAVLPDGRIFQSSERPFTWYHFHQPELQWKQVNELPGQAAYIGNYEVPADL